MYESELVLIAEGYFSKDEINTINTIISSAPDFKVVLEFDSSLGGIGLFNVNRGRTGRYHVEDRDIFRPLQYIYMNLENRWSDLSWYTRDIIHMCGLHLESIIKRFTGKHYDPLGKNLLHKKCINNFDKKLLSDLKQIAKLYNAAKHDVSPQKDEHLFSISEAIFSYFITRQIANKLYSFIKLHTIAAVWEE